MATRTLKVVIEGEGSSFTGTLQQAEKQMGGFAGKAQEWGKTLSKAGSTMTRGLTLPIVGGLALAFKEANEAIKVARQTEAVIKSTGGAANVTAKEVGNLANRLSEKTAIDDEVIQSGANLLLTFKNIKNEAGKGNDVFDQTTKIMLDMSTALGQDTTTSAMQLGKALNDPIKGLTALQRVGVTFTEQQKEQIRTLVESGHTMEAQKIILKELASEFGGSAEAAATPWDRFRVKMQNAAEEIGMKAMPILQRFTDVVVTLVDAFLGLPDWAQDFILGAAAVAAASGPMLKFAGAGLQAVSVISNLAGKTGEATSGLGGLGIALGITAGAFAVGQIAASQFRTGALDPLKTATQDAQTAEMGLTEAIREQGTVLGETTRQWIEHNAFQGEAGKNLLHLLGATHTSLGEVERALLTGGEAWQNMTHRLQDAASQAGLSDSQLLAVVTRLLSLRAGAEGAEQRVRDLNTVLGQIPPSKDIYITAHWRGFMAPTIPGNASGTDFWRGGPTWVGERGPELLDLPRGSRITPHAESMALARNGNGSGGPTYNVTVHAGIGTDGAQVGRQIVEKISEFERRNGKRWRS